MESEQSESLGRAGCSLALTVDGLPGETEPDPMAGSDTVPNEMMANPES